MLDSVSLFFKKAKSTKKTRQKSGTLERLSVEITCIYKVLKRQKLVTTIVTYTKVMREKMVGIVLGQYLKVFYAEAKSQLQTAGTVFCTITESISLRNKSVLINI